MLGYFSGIFASDFLPHGVCMRWQPDVLWLHVVSDALIALAYLCIPILLVSVVRKRKDMPFHWMFLAFGTFILACGATHVMSIVTLWVPLYRFDGLVKALTAVASITTAVCLARLMPLLLSIPTPSELARANQTLEAEILERRSIQRELQQSRHELEIRVNEQTQELWKLNAALQAKVEQELRTSEMLREKETQIEMACEGGKVATWNWDFASDRFTWTGRREAQHGPRSSRDGDQNPAENFASIHPGDQETVRLAFENAVLTGRDYHVEFRVRYPDETVYWLVGQGAVQRDAEGRPVRMTGVNIDVTARREAEIALKQSEEQFGVLADAIPNLAWMAKPDGYIFWYNLRWYEFTNTTPEQVEGWGWQSVHDPEHLPTVMARWLQTIRHGEPFEMEFPLRSGSGEFKWFLTRVLPLRDAAGNVVRWFGTNTDITELRTSREALRESESHFRQVSDALPAMVWTAQPDGSARWFNQRWYHYTGTTLQQSEDRNWFQFVHPDGRKNVIDTWERSVETGEPFQSQFRCRNKHGDYRWFLGRAHPVRGAGGSIVTWFGTCSDIEDYKQAETEIINLNESLEQRVQDRTEQLAQANATLAATRSQLQAVLDAATGVAIVAADLSGVISIFNTGAERMLQYRAEEVIGIHTPEVLHLRAEIEAESRVLSGQLDRLITGMEVFHYPARCARNNEREWTYVRKDGSTLNVYLTVTAMRAADAQITGYLEIATDITARKSLESELLNKNQELVLETARVVEANRAKSAFLATMSHEIRTPMNAILGMADLLWESPLDDEQRQYVEVFRRAGNNLLCLINDILDFSKIEAGHFELESMEFDLEDVLSRCVELVSPNVSAKGVSLLCSLHPAVPTALIGDPARLQQILVNLLGNAAKFTHQGEIVVFVRPAESGRTGELEFAVKDTGIGVPLSRQRAIFDDFTQADVETARTYGGTGLGLGICRRLVSKMRGKMTLEGTPGEGSTFRFTAQFGLGQAKKQLPARALEDLHDRRALIIDDNPTNSFILHETLGSWGLRSSACETAEEGAAALQAASREESPFSLIFLDRRSPGVSAFDKIRLLRDVDSRIPIIMLTSDSRSGDATKCRELGLAGYAVKPVRRADLLRLICDAIEVPAPFVQKVNDVPATEAPSFGQVRPMRILVAEDSLDNRVLLRAYLKRSPHILTFADNGEMAVERFAAEAFDLVLMDIQMPVMDGLQATRLIREREKQQGLDPTPIVALTANALPPDIEASRAAGCDAHLSKPISKAKLFGAVAQFSRYEQQLDLASEPIFVQAPEGLEALVPAYLEARKKELTTLVKLMQASEFDRISRVGHDLKGTGESFGFPDLTRIGADLEKSANKQSLLELGEELTRLADFLGRVQLQTVDPATLV